MRGGGGEGRAAESGAAACFKWQDTHLDELVDVLRCKITQRLRELRAAQNDLKVGNSPDISFGGTLLGEKSLECIFGGLFKKLEEQRRLALKIVKQHLVVFVHVRKINLHKVLSALPLVNQCIAVNELGALAKVAEKLAKTLPSCRRVHLEIEPSAPAMHRIAWWLQHHGRTDLFHPPNARTALF